jgi:hypothetical protein
MTDDASSIENLLSAGADRDFFFSSDERNQRRFFFFARANEREREIRSRRRVLIRSFAPEEKTL